MDDTIKDMNPTEILLARIAELKDSLGEFRAELKEDLKGIKNDLDSEKKALLDKIDILERRIQTLEIEAAKFQGSTKVVIGIVSLLGLGGIASIARALGAF